MARAAELLAVARKGGAEMVEDTTDKVEIYKAATELVSGVGSGVSSSAKDATPTAAGGPTPGRTRGGSRVMTGKAAQHRQIPIMKPPAQGRRGETSQQA